MKGRIDNPIIVLFNKKLEILYLDSLTLRHRDLVHEEHNIDTRKTRSMTLGDIDRNGRWVDKKFSEGSDSKYYIELRHGQIYSDMDAFANKKEHKSNKLAKSYRKVIQNTMKEKQDEIKG